MIPTGQCVVSVRKDAYQTVNADMSGGINLIEPTLRCKGCGHVALASEFPNISEDKDDDQYCEPYCPICSSTSIVATLCKLEICDRDLCSCLGCPNRNPITDCLVEYVPQGQCFCGNHLKWNGKDLEKIPTPSNQALESIPIIQNKGMIHAFLSIADGFVHDPKAKQHLFDVFGLMNPYYVSSSLVIEKLERLGFEIDQIQEYNITTYTHAHSTKYYWFFSVYCNPDQKELLLKLLEIWFTTNKILPESFWSDSNYKKEFEMWMIENRCQICIAGEDGNCHDCKAEWFATGTKAGYWDGDPNE